MKQVEQRRFVGADAKRLTRGEDHGMADFDTVGRQPWALD